MQQLNGITPISYYNLRKQIDGRPLLNIKKLTIPASSCLFLSGDNGAGKTTLLKIISGLMMPDHAEICYQGKTLSWSSARHLIQHEIIYLHQTPYIFDASVSNNIAYGLRCRGYSSSEINDRVDDALRWSGLAKFASRNARQLSGGERQRVVLTRACILRPHVLLLDEPLTGLDYNARIQTLSLIEYLMSEGMGIVVTGHDVETSMSMSTEHLHLYDGMLLSFEQHCNRIRSSVTNTQPGWISYDDEEISPSLTFSSSRVRQA